MSKLVIIESPYAGDISANEAYARACMRDCIDRGETPLASHLLYTQSGILDEDKPEGRQLGIDMGYAWGIYADKIVVYRDRGISPGMLKAIDFYEQFPSIDIEYRRLLK